MTTAPQTIRLAIRGFLGRNLVFEERLAVSDEEMETILPALAEKHAEAIMRDEVHMIEIEFLDEPDHLRRFFRFGTDPTGMRMPVKVIADGRES